MARCDYKSFTNNFSESARRHLSQLKRPHNVYRLHFPLRLTKAENPVTRIDFCRRPLRSVFRFQSWFRNKSYTL
ncbi:hypothetical protein PC115_g14962 [Phytophthora cactorum]|nr:hypothetical protein PC115_g14962 [Phytophthora cactorum]KAG3006586.1 hypothetical protein PC120_g17283 [Phytophthora cactorum]KAG3061368.1 hypothetical protein PC121_g13029 [Phytophthora cactorum]